VSGPNNLLKPNPITKTQCNARLNAGIWLDEMITTLRVVLKLNNDLNPTKVCYFRSSKNLMPFKKGCRTQYSSWNKSKHKFIKLCKNLQESRNDQNQKEVILRFVYT